MKHSFGIVQFHKVFNNFSSLDTNARNLIKMNEPFPPYTLFGGAKNRKLHSYAIELYVASAQRNKFYTFDYFSWRFFFHDWFVVEKYAHSSGGKNRIESKSHYVANNSFFLALDDVGIRVSHYEVVKMKTIK